MNPTACRPPQLVNFPGDPRMIDQFVDVTITQAMSNSLRGRLATADTATT